MWLTDAVCYRSECCTAFKVASRHKRRLPTGYPPTSEVIRQVEGEQEFLFARALT
jgi:hypothetical protein